MANEELDDMYGFFTEATFEIRGWTKVIAA